MKMDKSKNNDLQNTTQKTKDSTTRNPLKSRMNAHATEVYGDHTPLVSSVLSLLLQV